MGILLDILSGIGNTLDVPGSMVRDTLGGENPFDQLMSPWSAKNRLTGRDLTRRWGLSGEEDTGLNMAGGVATEMALDPLMWLGAGLLTKALKGSRVAAGATKAAASPMQQAFRGSARPATALSVASPVAGAYLMGDNATRPPEQQEAWKNWLGAGLMTAPLVLGMAKGAKSLAAKKALPTQFTRLRSVKDNAGRWNQITEATDLLSSDELKDSLNAWGTGNSLKRNRKFSTDALIARGDIPATDTERIAAATRIMQEFPAHHTWQQRAAKLQSLANESGQ